MFDAKPQWRTLRTVWRMQSASALLIPLVIIWLMGDWNGVYESAAIPLFTLAMASLFLTLWRWAMRRARKRPGRCCIVNRCWVCWRQNCPVLLASFTSSARVS